MATLRSTMGAPLNDEEEEGILSAWAALIAIADTLISVPRDDQPAQLDKAAEIVGAISTFRSAVHNGWYYANKRAWPAPEREVRVKRGPRPMTNAEALAALGLTQEKLDAALAAVEKEDD